MVPAFISVCFLTGDLTSLVVKVIIEKVCMGSCHFVDVKFIFFILSCMDLIFPFGRKDSFNCFM